MRRGQVAWVMRREVRWRDLSEERSPFVRPQRMSSRKGRSGCLYPILTSKRLPIVTSGCLYPMHRVIIPWHGKVGCKARLFEARLFES